MAPVRTRNAVGRAIGLCVALALGVAAVTDSQAICSPAASGTSSDTHDRGARVPNAPLEDCAGSPCKSPSLAAGAEIHVPVVHAARRVPTIALALAGIEAPAPPTPPPIRRD